MEPPWRKYIAGDEGGICVLTVPPCFSFFLCSVIEVQDVNSQLPPLAGCHVCCFLPCLLVLLDSYLSGIMSEYKCFLLKAALGHGVHLRSRKQSVRRPKLSTFCVFSPSLLPDASHGFPVSRSQERLFSINLKDLTFTLLLYSSCCKKYCKPTPPSIIPVFHISFQLRDSCRI